jgi:hypothetical protein
MKFNILVESGVIFSGILEIIFKDFIHIQLLLRFKDLIPHP